MAHAVERGWRPGRALALVAALLLAGGVLTLPTSAQDKDKAPDKPAEKPKEPPSFPTPPRPRIINLPQSADGDLREVVELINTKLETAWKENKVTPARPADDYEFLRRASLDIVGRIAKSDEMQKYFADAPNVRRTRLIDRLLASPDYARHWANVWANWTLSRAGAFGRGMYHEQMATWLEQQFSKNRPYNQIVEELITAKGKNTDNGAVNFILGNLGERAPAARRGDGRFEVVPITSRITRLFLGIQTQCTQCHDHPFDDNLKQDHFWGINVMLRQVSDEGTLPRMLMGRQMTFPPLTLSDDAGANPDAVIAFEKRNGVFKETKAAFFGKKVDLNKAPNRREELARLVVEHDNFSRAIVNRMWGSFFGKGFVNPIDDFNAQTLDGLAHAELLDELGKKFKHYGYDTKRLIRWICNSEAYNLGAVANRTNDKAEHEVLFSRMLLKAMSPEQMFESLMVATLSDKGKEARQQQLDRWLGALVTSFGDDEGNEVNFNGTIVQALMMMNGQDINAAIEDGGGTVAKAMERARRPVDVVNAIYLAALNRRVGAAEYNKLTQRMRMPIPDKSAAGPYHDLMWALLNSNEFILNH